MAEVWFYHLERRSVEQELPSLLQRGLERGLRMAVYAPSDDRLKDLSVKLWAHEDVAFIPHGFSGEDTAAQQPVLLCTDGAPSNNARFGFYINGAEPFDAHAFERVTIMFDGTSEQRVQQARDLWKRFKAEVATIRYWKQDDDGRWKDQAG
jgi:DNA polymerase III subunit chi